MRTLVLLVNSQGISNRNFKKNSRNENEIIFVSQDATGQIVNIFQRKSVHHIEAI